MLQLYYKAAIFELELRKCTLRTRLVPQRCAFRAGAAEVYCACYNCTTKLRILSWSCGSVLCVLHLCFEAAEVYFACYTCTTKLRFSIWSCASVLRVLHLYSNAAIFKLKLRKCTSRGTLVLQSCDFRAGAAEVYLAY